MFKKDELIIYWTMNQSPSNSLIKDPVNLFTDIVKDKEPKVKNISFFSCPAVADRLKNSFVFKNNVETTFMYDFTNKDYPIVKNANGLDAQYYKPSNFSDKAAVEVLSEWFFFSEEQIECLINPPSFHPPTDFYKKGFIPGGKVNIGNWFRPVRFEMQMWDFKNHLTIKEDDPLFYLEALTDKNVKLKKFNMTQKIHDISKFCTDSPSRDGRNLPLSERYNIFRKNNKHEELLTEIKRNVVE
jgi:hypothetical protein